MLAIVLALSACDSPLEPGEIEPLRQNASAEEPATGEQGAAGEPGGSGFLATGEATAWPNYIPDDIPALPDNIRKVMEGGSHIRIFYHELSQERIDEYLELVEDNGFQLKYMVYQDERYPDDEAAEERLEKGDFDAVHITKGDYELRITYGGRETVLDVSTSGWEDANPFAPVREWPADLTDVPMPDRCGIEGVYAQDSGGYQIVCTPEDVPCMARPPVGSNYPGVLSRESIEITLEYSNSRSTFRLTVWRLQPEDLPSWPSELAGIILQPEGTVVDIVQEWGKLDYMISCRGQSDQMLLDYAEQLTSQGFREIRRTEAGPGDAIAVTLTKEPFTVDLTPGATGELLIRITDEAITYTD